MAEQPMAGSGEAVLRAAPGVTWTTLLDPVELHAAIPGAERVERIGAGRYRATISFGVGWVRGRYVAELDLSDMREPEALALHGQSAGFFGRGEAFARVTLSELADGRTRVAWTYQGSVSGPVARVGRRLLQVGSDLFIQRFFATLAHRIDPSKR